MSIRLNGVGFLVQKKPHGFYFGSGFRSLFRFGRYYAYYDGEHHVFSVGWFYVTWGEA